MSWHPEPLLKPGRTIGAWPPLMLFLWLAAAAALAQPTDSGYRLGPGDRIIIKVFGEEDLSMDVRLNDAGRLNYRCLGELVVQGLTVTELERLITRGLKGSYLRDPAVTVSIAEYRPFFLYGEVQKPGGIPYQPDLTVERAIALAGGLSERASRSQIEVVRASDPKHKAVRNEPSPPVYPGDVIPLQQSIF